jgi:hypothetical protein
MSRPGAFNLVVHATERRSADHSRNQTKCRKEWELVLRNGQELTSERLTF